VLIVVAPCVVVAIVNLSPVSSLDKSSSVDILLELEKVKYPLKELR
jgi:hypothetical protein